MDPKTAAAAYKTASIENAPGIKIVRMLYEGALRFIDRARTEGPSVPAFGTWVSRADEIVVELRCALRAEHGEELCTDLERLYLFVEDRLGSAMRDRVTAPLDEAHQILQTLLEAWRQVEVTCEAK